MFTFGECIKITLFGSSHGDCVGVTVQGLPAGFEPDLIDVQKLLDRRRATKAATSTARREADTPQIISGLFNGKTTGAPLTAVFSNSDTHSGDYNPEIPRPGHADYPAYIKYGGCADYRGGGFFSGRMTVGMCFAGALAMQLLAARGVKVCAEIDEIGDVNTALINGDSAGGIIKCTVEGLPVGVGEPIFGSVESVLSSAMFSIPAVKGVEFGAGFAAAALYGSENNDEFFYDNGAVRCRTNNAGGILGGLTNGMPLVLRVAVKPTPSIKKPQQSVDLAAKNDVSLLIEGRHDACIVPRAVPVVEAMTAFAILDLIFRGGF